MSSFPLVGLVFSRDRAMQLDALLRSLIKHCRDHQQVQFFVIYRASNPQHTRQYSMLESQYAPAKNIQFIPEGKFRSDLYRCVLAIKFGDPVSPFLGKILAFGWKAGLAPRLEKEARFLLFLVDDNIIFSDFSFDAVLNALRQNEKAIGFSLRLGLNITHSYTLDNAQNLDRYSYQNDQVIEYEWISAEGDFGYPLEVSSSVYRYLDLLPLLARLRFDNPNTLESLLALNSQRFDDIKPRLLCFDRSVTFCNPINKVQTRFENRAGREAKYSCQSLADLFDDGYRIDINEYSGFVPNSCHQEVELALMQHTSEYP
jgi:hypothetical protein